MSTEVLGFAEKEMRDEQARRWKSEGSKGVATYSTHEGNDPKIIWVVTRSEPAPRCEHGVWAADHCYQCEKRWNLRCAL